PTPLGTNRRPASAPARTARRPARSGALLTALLAPALLLGAPLRAASFTPLPLVLDSGWEAADGDPPGGIAGLDALSFRPADTLAKLEGSRARLDQALTFFSGIVLTIAIVFYLFSFQARRAREYPLFATFSVLLGLYALTLHSGWGSLDVSRELPFRLSAFAS